MKVATVDTSKVTSDVCNSKYGKYATPHTHTRVLTQTITKLISPYKEPIMLTIPNESGKYIILDLKDGVQFSNPFIREIEVNVSSCNGHSNACGCVVS